MSTGGTESREEVEGPTCLQRPRTNEGQTREFRFGSGLLFSSGEHEFENLERKADTCMS